MGKNESGRNMHAVRWGVLLFQFVAGSLAASIAAASSLLVPPNERGGGDTYLTAPTRPAFLSEANPAGEIR